MERAVLAGDAEEAVPVRHYRNPGYRNPQLHVVISNVGGIMGVLVGMSVFSITEIVFVLVQVCYVSCTNSDSPT